jgi:hypothetical protein
MFQGRLSIPNCWLRTQSHLQSESLRNQIDLLGNYLCYSSWSFGLDRLLWLKARCLYSWPCQIHCHSSGTYRHMKMIHRGTWISIFGFQQVTGSNLTVLIAHFSWMNLVSLDYCSFHLSLPQDHCSLCFLGELKVLFCCF